MVNINSKLSSLVHMLQTVRLSDTWQKLEHGDVLLVRSDLHCGYTYQGKAYAHLLDSMVDLFAEHGLVTRSVAAPYSKLTGIDAYNSPVSCNRYALYIALLKRIARLITNRAYSKDLANEHRAQLWGRILEKVKPVCVIGIQPDVGLCRAGKIKGIPVYDLQHGVIADEHSTYGKEYRVDTPPRDLPDGFLCWDESSAAVLRKWSLQKGIDVRVVGNIWFSRFLFMKPNDLLVQEAINTGRIFNNSRPVILVSLAWGMGKFYNYAGFNGVMVAALEKAILETEDTYNWLLRLHPIQIRGTEKEIAQGYLTRTFGHLGSVEWHICSELPLPVVLQQVDLHITDASTVVVEAGWMGVYSALLNSHVCPGGILENYFAHERNLGMAVVLPQDTNIIKQWIADTLTQGRGNSTLADTNEALLAFIEAIVGDAGTKLKYSRAKKGDAGG